MPRYAIAHCGADYTVCRFPDDDGPVQYLRDYRKDDYTWTKSLMFARAMTENTARKHAEKLTFLYNRLTMNSAASIRRPSNRP